MVVMWPLWIFVKNIKYSFTVSYKCIEKEEHNKLIIYLVYYNLKQKKQWQSKIIEK
jgi:hypothetical protein